jgi:hypothetical protein
METVMKQTHPISVYVLMFLLLFLAVNALYGGYSLIADPSGGSLGMPVSLLSGSPFVDYFIPGLILFGVLGVFPLLVLVALWFKPSWLLMSRLERIIGEHWAWAAAFIAGSALTVWIIVQMTILSFWLQPILLALGLVIMGVSLLPSVRSYYAL